MPVRAAVLAILLTGLLLAQREFKEYAGNEYVDFPLPSDWQKKTEWTRARLMYPDYGGRRRFRGGAWTTDYPRSDRHLLEGVRRLTRIDSRSVEQVTELDGSDDIYNWPMLYAVEVGQWELNKTEAAQLRDFIDRGGFFMVDDFHGDIEWSIFVDSFNRVFPDRQIVEIESSDPIFHTLYDLNDRFQVPGLAALSRGLTYERGADGKTPHWRGVYDDKNRLVAVICHNMDLGDAWEHSDDPWYPADPALLAYRIGMNYFVYDLTH